MLQAIIEKSVRHRHVTLLLGLIVTAYGAYAAAHARLDVFPDFVPPQVAIQTEAPGLSPEQVETLVTRRVESMLLGLSSLESVRSQSIAGLSVITVVFSDAVNIFTARQMLNERLAEIGSQLPLGVHTPRMTPLMSSTMDLYKIGLTADAASGNRDRNGAGTDLRNGRSEIEAASGAQAVPPSDARGSEIQVPPLTPMQLRTFADWVVRPRILAVPGMANVTVYGGEVRQIQVQLRPDRMAALSVSIQEVIAAARGATGVRGAGFIETQAQRVLLQTEGQSLTAAQIGDVVVRQSAGMTLRLRDVAAVSDGPQPKFGDALIDGRPGIFMAMLSQYGSNTAEATTALEAALDELEPACRQQGVTLHRGLFRPATFIETAIHNIGHSLLLGGLLVAVILFLFMWNLRGAVISLTAIPISLLVAVIVLDAFGATLNTITLGGLAIAIGEVVDDAIIDVENIFRRLRENAARPDPRPAYRVVLDASLEVRSAVVYATFVVILVFIPILTMTGLQGRLFAPLGQAYILAVLASLATALTVTPAAAMVLLPGRAGKAHEPGFIRRFKHGYMRLLQWVSPHPGLATTSILLLCVLGLAYWPRGGDFLPEFREGHFVVQINASPGTSLEGSRRLGAAFARDALRSPLIKSVPQQIGRAELGEDTWGPNRSEFHINLAPGLHADDEEQAREVLEKALARLPGVTTELTTFLGDRIGETISGDTAEVVVSVFGDDLDVLDREARAVHNVLKGIAGQTDLHLGSPPGMPQLVVKLRPERLLQFGMSPVDVLETVETAYQGTTAAQTYEADRLFDVVVMLEESQRRNPEQVGNLLLRAGDGTLVPLRELADIYLSTARSLVLHDNARRRQTVACNVTGRDVTSFVEEAKRRVASQVVFAPGTYPSFGGAAAARAAAAQQLFVHSGVAAAGILLLLGVVVGNIQNLALVVLNLPFALVGGVLAMRFFGGVASMGALVGFVTLFGITTRNSIMLVSHYEHLVGTEGMTWGLDAALRGASERLVPILMTALVTGLGLLPIALGSGEAGREIEGPMAVVILGGLATSTVLNLLVLPLLALQWGRFLPNVSAMH